MAEEADKPVEFAPAAEPVEAPVVEASAPAEPEGDAAPAEAAIEPVAIEAIAEDSGAAPVAAPKAARVAAVRKPRKVKPAPVVAEPAPAVKEKKSARTRRAAAPAQAPARRKVPATARAATAGTPARKVRTAKPIPAPTNIKIASKSSPKPFAPKPVRSQIKETVTMAKTIPTDFVASFQNVFSDFQGKAKEGYEKSTAAFGEANDFAKGNVEALVESGKILASGIQELGTGLVSESRAAFETLTADVKELAAVKSPTDFFTAQSALLRKSFDAAVANASKNTEAMMKLANEVITPLSSRVTVAVEKVSKAA